MALRVGTDKLCQMSASRSNMRMVTSRLSAFSTQPQLEQPVVLYINNESKNQNKLLGPSKQFPLPGDVCHQAVYNKVSQLVEPPVKVEMKTPTVSVNELLDVSANQVKRGPQPNDGKVQERTIEMTVNECPRLLRKDLKALFPGEDLSNKQISVLNITQKSKNDMSAWSADMEVERMQLTAGFIESATAICNILRRFGYWADLIDPASGRPYFGKFTNATLFETDDSYRNLGFEIEDLGCCKVLKHIHWGVKAFVGTIFTDAPIDSPATIEILSKVNAE